MELGQVIQWHSSSKPRTVLLESAWFQFIDTWEQKKTLKIIVLGIQSAE
jgi:hypothetical protein